MALSLFETEDLVKICAPMVRYSKLAFRNLVLKYNCDLVYTPMIMADSFVLSEKARSNEFTTNSQDTPLIAQFASNNVDDFVRASVLVSPHVNGVDLNCGCPQRWAFQEGIGACMINKPQLIYDIVHQTKSRISADGSNFSVSVKIRIHSDIARTVDLCRKVESAGVSYITVHGRTKEQRADPVNYAAIGEIKKSVRIPVVANGDIFSLSDANHVAACSNVDGVMCARGILENPTMFTGTDYTPASCVSDWIKVSQEVGTPFSCFHHHLIYMCERTMSKAERKVFNGLSSFSSVIDYLQMLYSI